MSLLFSFNHFFCRYSKQNLLKRPKLNKAFYSNETKRAFDSNTCNIISHMYLYRYTRDIYIWKCVFLSLAVHSLIHVKWFDAVILVNIYVEGIDIDSIVWLPLHLNSKIVSIKCGFWWLNIAQLLSRYWIFLTLLF